MSVDQDTTSYDIDDQLSMHRGWFPSGWPHYLPQYQSMTLTMLFSTAAVRGLHGSVDDVLAQIFPDEPGSLFNQVGGSLDAPVLWVHADQLDSAETEEERNQLRADAEERRARCEELLRTAGLAVPETIRELADTMMALGIADLRDGVWSMPETIPGPESVLALTHEERAAIEDLRRGWEGGPAEQTLIDHLMDDLECPAEIFTSVDRLARATGLSEDDLRHALDRLIREDGARLERGAGREQTALDDLKGHERFHLVLDWQRFDETRLIYVRD